MKYNLEKGKTGNVDLSFLSDPSISKEDFFEKLANFFYYFYKISGQREILHLLPEIKKSLEKPEAEEEFDIINLELSKITISYVLKELDNAQREFRKAKDSAGKEEEEDYNTILKTLETMETAFQLIMSGLEEEDEKKIKKALPMLYKAGNEMGKPEKEEDLPLYSKIEMAIDKYERGKLNKEKIEEFILESRELLKSVSMNYSNIYVEEDDVTEEVLKGDEFFQKGLNCYFESLDFLEKALEEDDEEKLEHAIKRAYKADKFFKELDDFTSEVNNSINRPEDTLQASMESYLERK